MAAFVNFEAQKVRRKDGTWQKTKDVHAGVEIESVTPWCVGIAALQYEYRYDIATS